MEKKDTKVYIVLQIIDTVPKIFSHLSANHLQNI